MLDTMLHVDHPRALEPNDEAPALPLLVMTSSLIDLVLRPTASPIDIKSIYIVEEAFATFLALRLEDQFDGSDGSAKLEEVDVTVKALRFTEWSPGRRLSENPSTILTTSVREKLRGQPDSISHQPGYLDGLVFSSFTDAKKGDRHQDILAKSSHPILNSVTDTEIFATSFAAFATGQASFAPASPGTSAAIIGNNEIATGKIYPEDQSPATSSSGPAFDRNDPMDLAFIGMSGIIFFAMIILIYLYRIKDKGPSHEERVRQFFAPESDHHSRHSRATTAAVFNDVSVDEGPISGAHFASESGGMLEDRPVQPKLSFSAPIPKLRPRPQISRYARGRSGSGFLNNASIAGLNPIPEDQAFASEYFDPDNLCRSDSSLSSDVFGVDISLGRDGGTDGLSPTRSEGSPDDNWSHDTAQSNGSSSRWNQWLQQVMVVSSGIRGNIREDYVSEEVDEYDADEEDVINVGTLSNSFSTENGVGESVSQLSHPTLYSC